MMAAALWKDITEWVRSSFVSDSSNCRPMPPPNNESLTRHDIFSLGALQKVHSHTTDAQYRPLPQKSKDVVEIFPQP